MLIMLILASSLVFYGSVNYGIVFDYGMIQNSVETNSAEAFSYLNFDLVSTFFIVGLMPALFIYKTPIAYQPLLKEVLSRIKLITLAIATIFVIAFFYYQDYASVGRNNHYLKKLIVPSQYLSSGFKYIKHNYFDEERVFSTLDKFPVDNSPTKKKLLCWWWEKPLER